MKKFFTLFMVLLTILSCSATENDVPQSASASDGTLFNGKKVLVAYFSWGGTTRRMAQAIENVTKGDIFEIEPVVPYPTAYTPCTEVALEEKNNNARPEIKNRVENWADYDIVFIGCPVWWWTTPMIIHTFAESYDFEGKTVVPFCTYAATYRDETLQAIVDMTPEAEHLEGLGTTGSTSGVEAWVNRISAVWEESHPNISVEEQNPEAIDLGLSVKWSSLNIGASSPTEYGGLYGWGDITGINHSENNDEYPSANPPSSICGTEYDIATKEWGNNWRMPSQAEMEELAEKCTWVWTTVNGVNGMTVTGPNGNSIFLPAAASRTGETVSNQVGQRGCYWSGTLWTDNKFASYLYFYDNADRVQPARSNRRYIGMSVRPVSAESAGIEDVSADLNSNDVTIYDLNGRIIKDTTNLKGIFIVKSPSKTYKVVL